MKSFSVLRRPVSLLIGAAWLLCLLMLLVPSIRMAAGQDAAASKPQTVKHAKKSAAKKTAKSAEKSQQDSAAPAKSVSKAAKKNESAGKSKHAKKDASAEKTKTEEDASNAAPAKGRAAGRGRRSHKPVSRHAPASKAVRTAQTAAIRKAFVASAELRPMAQQLATLRTPEGYAGVAAYARNHTGDAAAAAYLALGNAYLLDRRFAEAESNLRQSKEDGSQLADYVDFLSAQAAHQAGNNEAAEALLHGFTERYPDSIFAAETPELEANVLLALNNAAAAQKVLSDAHGLAAEDRTGFQLASAEVAYALGQRDEAARLYKQILIAHPLSGETQSARTRLAQLGVESSLSVAERRSLADAYFNGKHFNDAAEQYRLLARSPEVGDAERNLFLATAAECDWKLKRLTRAEAEALANSDDDAGALRMYLLMELARDRESENDQRQIVAEMQTRFPRSSWLAEALFSSGNMYLLKRDYPSAIEYYSTMAERFPNAKNGSLAHWKAAWLSYRQGLFDEAAKLMEAQIRLYPSAPETVSALYWRGRLYELRDHAPAQAAANYRALLRSYPHYFYAQMARQRLEALGNQPAASDAKLDGFQPPQEPNLIESFPEASPHLAKARLLANAGLNDYVAREINADPDFANMGDLAAAQIYASYGETFRALRLAKRALSYSASASMQSIPLAYWQILYPQPYWATIKAEAARKNLDPYLVASLIRQESEFSPSVISYANAYGLMQLLPTTGKMMAREEGIGSVQPYQLLDPETNIKLGTRYLHQLLEKFGGVQEYALAAYNAGDGRVVDWEAAGPYRGMDEFVESIPFTQTREYVEAILRNEEMYRLVDAMAHGRSQPNSEAAH
jgi:soluble lytic murein transglycosylase